MPPKELPKGQGQAEPEKPPKKRSRFKIIMLGVGLLLLLAGGGGAGYWWLYLRPDATGLAGLLSAFDSGDEESQASGDTPPAGKKADAGRSANASKPARAGENATAKGAPASAPRSVQKPVPLPELTVNLADAPGNRYLKIGMEVEFNTPDAGKTIQNETARVRDAIILLLSGKTVRELSSPDGKVMLKNEVAGRLNQILGSAQVVRVYFTDFVIQ